MDGYGRVCFEALSASSYHSPFGPARSRCRRSRREHVEAPYVQLPIQVARAQDLLHGRIGSRGVERVLDAQKDSVSRAHVSSREFTPGLLDKVGQRIMVGLGRAAQSVSGA